MTTLLELAKKLHNTLALYNAAGHALGWSTEKADKLLDESKRVIELAEQPAPAQEPKKDLMYSTVAMQERHAALVDRVVATLEQAKREALAKQPANQEPVTDTELINRGCHYQTELTQPAQQEPVDFASLLREADEIVREKPTWRRFIDGTPLPNDIAVWMTVFAQDVARRTSLAAQPQQEPVAFITPLIEQQMFDDWCPYKGNPDPRTVWAAAIESVNGLLLGASPPAQQPSAKCWKCGDSDPAYTDVCQVPACGMREA